MNEKVVSRYLKVKALAIGGSDGEKVAAQKILASLEEKNPGIEAEAAKKEKGSTSSSTSSPFDGYWPPGGSPSPGRERQGNWENIFKYAKWAYEAASDIAETVVDAQKGREVSEDVEFSGRKRGSALYVSLKFTYDLVRDARGLNSLQQETFRQGVHEKLDEYLDAILAEP
jgi:hypothetical protein